MRWKLAVASVFLLLVTGCDPRADVTVKDSDNGRQIQLNRGQVLELVLFDDYQTSKCQWNELHDYDTTIIQFVLASYSGDTHQSWYKAARAGRVHLTLTQQDNAYPPHICRRFALDITVH